MISFFLVLSIPLNCLENLRKYFAANMDSKGSTLKLGFDTALARKHLVDRIAIDQDRNQFMTVSRTNI